MQSIAGERVYGRIERTDTGPDYEFRPCVNKGQQQQFLAEWIGSSLKRGFKPQEIVVLSFSKDADSVAGSFSGNPGFENLRPFREADRDSHIRFGTVHAFKGLDVRAVVVTDVSGPDKEKRRNLLYVAVSRARDRLLILRDKGELSTFQSLTARKLENRVRAGVGSAI